VSHFVTKVIEQKWLDGCVPKGEQTSSHTIV